MTTPAPSEHRETEDLLRAALRTRVADAPPAPSIGDLHARAAGAPSSPARVPRRRTAVGRGLVAVAAAVALAVGVAVALPGADENRDRATSSPASTGDVPSVLRRIAAVAATTPMVPAPRPDQFVYTKRVGVAIPRHAPQSYVGPPQPSTLESWIAQDPGADGLDIFDGERDVVEPNPPDGDGLSYGPTTYAQFAALPTDPVAMRAYLDESTDGRPFRGAELILNGNLVPPAVASAIYLALADVPGLVVDPDVVDPLGRQGLGISQVSATGERLELVFARDGLQLLGYRSVWTRDENPDRPGLASRRAGQVVASYAVVERAVVDRAGDRPR